ncbi:hypothetical protein GUB10_15610 [Salegentibacter sp. BLCTC]|uniref:restriction endonuclease n=1 Tax=Salegentibacter sp. BLCTC TaxID=2697368 RepID=UPI00187B389F|nr:hypothetical protein [Salegentibacter sp. BLCTC]
MTNFDFHNLLFPSEFEELCRDILQIKESPLKFRTFGEWRDNGIDIECTTSKERIIGQCKRYNPSNYPALKSSLKQEVLKCKKLNADRYILCVSLSLGVGQFEDIITLFDGHLKKDDIIDSKKLNQYLGEQEYQHLKKSYSKLLVPNLSYVESLLDTIINKEVYRKFHKTTESFLRDINKNTNFFIM